MGQKKGQTGNPNGRPKGTPNRTTKEAKEFLKNILYAEFDNIQASLQNARNESDAKYIDLLTKLLQFVLPKQVEAEGKGKIEIKVTYGNKRQPDSSLT